jgi:hypothetical protein
MLTEHHERRISVEKLIELLNPLPKDTLIEVNRVSNLTTSLDGVYVGFIDIGTEQYDEFPESWRVRK